MDVIASELSTAGLVGEESGMGNVSQVLLVGGSRLFADCLSHHLQAGSRVEVVARMGPDGALAERVGRGDVDLVLVDLGCSEEEARRFHEDLEERPGSVRLMVLRMSEERGDYVDWARIGARAFLSAEASMVELDEAVDRVLAGEAYCSPRATYALFERLHRLSRRRQRVRQVQDLVLSPREMEVLQLVSQELSNKEIAERLCLSVYTVKNHVHHILDKLDVDCREAAVREAYGRDWLLERRQAMAR